MQGPLMKELISLVYPPRCVACGEQVLDEGGLCGPCWRQTPFITGLVCDLCGVPLIGAAEEGVAEYCDDCLGVLRPWSRGRAALVYAGQGRRLVLKLKHEDRHDLVAPMAHWMAQAARPLLQGASGEVVAVPVPLHWRRLMARRFNQSALLARGVARRLGIACAPAALRRIRHTAEQEGRGHDARFANLAGAIVPGRRARERLAGRTVLIVDDVMTSGATLSAAAEAARASGAREVFALVLARVAKAP
ncbi:ComF family protein [Meinhardsimonia xiamenensis]|nr:ComF family protein [Meinhardsimonia xiamenensis]